MLARTLIAVAIPASLALVACSENAETTAAATPGAEATPSAVAPPTDEAVQLPAAIAALLDAEFAAFGQPTYYAGAVDLDGDGSDEWLAYVAGPGICGTGGCPLRVFRETAGGIETKGQLSVVQLPVGVFNTRTEGWRDLAITIGGGGIDYSLARVPYDGVVYASNPTVAPATPSSEDFSIVIAYPEM